MWGALFLLEKQNSKWWQELEGLLHEQSKFNQI